MGEIKQGALYALHSRALTLSYADLESYGLSVSLPFLGSAGSVVERQNAGGFSFYAHQFYDGDGKKAERYVAGPVGNEEADATATALRSRIAELKELVPSMRLLGREGFNLVDSRTYATLASLTKHGVFLAGATLVGSHAFGIILNRLGIRAVPYATEDIDIARNESLAFKAQPTGFLEMLRDSGIEFVEVPGLDHKTPASSFKQRGRARFHVDLLVPSRSDDFPVVHVPELQAYATGLPYLDYLLEETQMAMLLAREGCCPVRVPLPERFAVHKVLVSQLRVGRNAKAGKDLVQASVLMAALADLHPGAIEEAKREVPSRAIGLMNKGIESIRLHLESKHPRAWAELASA